MGAGGEEERGDGIDSRAVAAVRGVGGVGGEMLWATKQLISLNLSMLHNATAHYRPIRHHNASLTEVY